MMHSKIPLAQTLVQLCKLYNFKNVVISPGSRNAPLIIGLTENPYFNCYSIVDERCAAFFALGISQQSKFPTVLVCTSGSALLNYYPAVAEAFYSNIPLIILSADRPRTLINIGDGQTILQPKVYGEHVSYSANLKLDIDPQKVSQEEELPIFKNLKNKIERFLEVQKSVQTYNEDEINKAFNTVINKSSPVHLNVPFSEPLYECTDELVVNPKKLRKSEHLKLISEEEIDDLAKEWNKARKKMILVGVLEPNSIDQQLLDKLAEDESVLIFTETTSNISSLNLFPNIDKIIAPLTEEECEELRPDILLTLGGMIVSKKIKTCLRTYQPKQHWHLGQHTANDTFFKLNVELKNKPNKFLKEFLTKVEPNISNYRLKWDLIKELREIAHKEYLGKIDFSDLKAFEILLKRLPQDIILQLGNSATIRYSQLFNIHPSIEVYCNRGTSGIDGSTSTAIGSAVARKKQTVFITGDLSFFYDSNALWNNYIPSNFRIIVINNQGGGIFKILPGEKNTKNFETFFETSHNLSCKQLCDMFGFKYYKTSDALSLKENLQHFYNLSESPKLLEVCTPNDKNHEILLQYFEYLK